MRNLYKIIEVGRQKITLPIKSDQTISHIITLSIFLNYEPVFVVSFILQFIYVKTQRKAFYFVFKN